MSKADHPLARFKNIAAYRSTMSYLCIHYPDIGDFTLEVRPSLVSVGKFTHQTNPILISIPPEFAEKVAAFYLNFYYGREELTNIYFQSTLKYGNRDYPKSSDTLEIKIITAHGKDKGDYDITYIGDDFVVVSVDFHRRYSYNIFKKEEFIFEDECDINTKEEIETYYYPKTIIDDIKKYMFEKNMYEEDLAEILKEYKKIIT
jgi:hypothetical protein